MRRASVFAGGENLGAGRIHSARAMKSPEGGGGLRPPEPKKEGHDIVVSLFLTEQGRADAFRPRKECGMFVPAARGRRR